MLFQKLAIIATLTALVAAQDVSQDDIPRQCTEACAQLVALSRNCDNQNNNDTAETECICNAPNANFFVPNCEVCVRTFDNDTDDDDNVNDNDVRDVLTRCNFTVQSSFNSAAASSVASAASVAPSGTAPSASASATPSGSVVVRTSGTVAVTVTSASAPPQQTQNAAATPTAAAIMGLGALGFALGML